MPVRAAYLFMVFIVSLVPLSAQEAAKPDNTRKLEAANVQYTLPGPEWVWHEEHCGPTKLMAKIPHRGIVMQVQYNTPSGDLDAMSKMMFSAQAKRKVIERVEKKETFVGLESYLETAREDDGLTIVTRIFISNDRLVILMAMGKVEDFEKSPELDAAMRGFSFIGTPRSDVPLTTSQPAPTPAKDWSARPLLLEAAGEIAIGVAVLVVVVVGLLWVDKKRKRRKANSQLG